MWQPIYMMNNENKVLQHPRYMHEKWTDSKKLKLRSEILQVHNYNDVLLVPVVEHSSHYLLLKS